MEYSKASRGAWLLLVVVFSIPVFGGESLRDLVRDLESRDREEREGAARKLGGVPGRTSLLLLVGALADPEPEVRNAAAVALGKRRDPAELDLLIERGLGHRDPRVRVRVLELLARARAPGLAEVLSELLGDRDPRVREAAVGHVSVNDGGPGTKDLAAAVTRGREGRPRAAALLRLADLDPEMALGLAGRHSSDAAIEVRVAALEILARASHGEALHLLLGGLTDESWSVRLTAMRELSVCRSGEAAPALIDALERETGRLRQEAGEALCTLTGVGLPPDPKRWRAWWAEAGVEFEPPEKRASAPEEDGSSAAAFTSIPFDSRCVAFVLDRSRSMRDRIDRGEEKRKGELVEEELEKTLARLASPVRFFLVAFGTEPASLSPRPLPATPAARAKALDWFRKRPCEGRTNLCDSLALALACDPVDTIFLLTDGAPSAGEEITRTGLLREVARLNRYRKALIHTVEIGGEATGRRWRGFLADLAKENGGRSVRR